MLNDFYRFNLNFLVSYYFMFINLECKFFDGRFFISYNFRYMLCIRI